MFATLSQTFLRRSKQVVEDVGIALELQSAVGIRK